MFKSSINIVQIVLLILSLVISPIVLPAGNSSVDGAGYIEPIRNIPQKVEPDKSNGEQTQAPGKGRALEGNLDLIQKMNDDLESSLPQIDAQPEEPLSSKVENPWPSEIDSETQADNTAGLDHGLVEQQIAYQQFVLENRRRVFGFQYISNIVVLFASVAVLGTGLCMAWMQFRNVPKDADGRTLHSTVKISSSEGIYISSPLMGLIVFLLSLVFFYFVITDFFTIEVVGG